MVQEDTVFAELVENVVVAIKYFNDKVESARQAGGWDWSVEKVLEVVKGGPFHTSPFPNVYRRGNSRQDSSFQWSRWYCASKGLSKWLRLLSAVCGLM